MDTLTSPSATPKPPRLRLVAPSGRLVKHVLPYSIGPQTPARGVCPSRCPRQPGRRRFGGHVRIPLSVTGPPVALFIDNRCTVGSRGVVRSAPGWTRGFRTERPQPLAPACQRLAKASICYCKQCRSGNSPPKEPGSCRRSSRFRRHHGHPEVLADREPEGFHG